MKKAILSIIILSLSTILLGQTAESIINQNLERSGGIQKWKSLNSIILKGDVTLGLEQTFPMHIYHKRPYEKRVVFLVQGKEMLSEGYDGKNGWTYNEISGKNEIIPNYQPDSFDSDILDYSKKGFEAQYLGIEQIDDKECYKVQLTKNINKIIYCFSTQDYSLTYEETDLETIYYYDYKTFDGLRFATKMIGQPKEGGEYVIRFYEIQINPAINDRLFKF